MINNYKKFNLKEITKENFSKEIPKVLEFQEKVKESLKKLGSYILQNLENKYIELVPSTTTFLVTVSS